MSVIDPIPEVVVWRPLCTVEQVVAELKLTDKSPDEDRIQDLINAASSGICTWAKQGFPAPAPPAGRAVMTPIAYYYAPGPPSAPIADGTITGALAALSASNILYLAFKDVGDVDVRPLIGAPPVNTLWLIKSADETAQAAFTQIAALTEEAAINALVFEVSPMGGPGVFLPGMPLYVENDYDQAPVVEPPPVDPLEGVPPDVNQAALMQTIYWFTQDSSRFSDSFASELAEVGQPRLPYPLLYAVQNLVRPYRLVTLW